MPPLWAEEPYTQSCLHVVREATRRLEETVNPRLEKHLSHLATYVEQIRKAADAGDLHLTYCLTLEMGARVRRLEEAVDKLQHDSGEIQGQEK